MIYCEGCDSVTLKTLYIKPAPKKYGYSVQIYCCKGHAAKTKL